MDDIEHETHTWYLLDEITDFVEMMELSTEEIISKHICSDSKKYIMIHNETLVDDLKEFLYDYCTTGEFYQIHSS